MMAETSSRAALLQFVALAQAFDRLKKREAAQRSPHFWSIYPMLENLKISHVRKCDLVGRIIREVAGDPGNVIYLEARKKRKLAGVS